MYGPSLANRLRVVFVCLLWFSAVPDATLAATNPGDQELIRDRQNRLLEEQQRRLEELRELPGKTPTPDAPEVAGDTRCFAIRQVDLQGAEQLSAAQQARLLAPYNGQCLGMAQLNQLLQVITDHYLQQGFVTSRAYLPQQHLGSGILRVQVVEGRLEQVNLAPGSQLSQREIAMAFPGHEGQLLNLRQVEQLLDQLNRLPSNRATMELMPGEAVGGSQVLLSNQPQQPWRAALARHNNGQKSTGEQQWNLGLGWDSPLGLADQLNLRRSEDAVSDHQRRSASNFLNYNLPWGWWNFSYSYSDSEYRTRGQGAGFDFKYSGESQTHQGLVERVIHRDAQGKTALSAGLSHLRTVSYIEDSPLRNGTQRITEAQFGFSHGRVLGSAFGNLELGMQQGLGALDAMSDKHAASTTPTARYRKYTATLSYLQPFKLWGEDWAFSSLATGQRSEDLLYNSQRISLTGQSAVRGYKEQFLSGDSGGYWRNDLRWTRQVDSTWLRPWLQQYGLGVAYDQGVVRRDAHSAGQNGRVSSNALELFGRGSHMGASLTLAHSLKRPMALSESEAPIYFRLEFFL